MNVSSFPGCGRVFGLSFALLLAGVMAGCGRDDIQVYQVSKEAPQVAAAASGLPAGHPDVSRGSTEGESARPKVTWQTPAGWEEMPPGEMRAASFRVKGEADKSADVSIVPLPGLAGSDLANVNRWRGQVGLAEVKEADLAKLAEAVQVGGQDAQLYDQAGQNPGSGEPTRILAAVLRRDGVAWFFKMTGSDALVVNQKPAFKQFLKSVGFGGATVAVPEAAQPAEIASPPKALSTNAKRSPRENAEKPVLIIPAGWQEVPAGQMLVAKFVIPGSGDAKAELNVSNLLGTGGGLEANVNRWRAQLGLSPLSGADLEKQTESLDVPGGKAIVVSLSGKDARTGKPARLLGAIVPQAEQTWFYKMLGDDQVVEREKAAFQKFVQTAKYGNAP